MTQAREPIADASLLSDRRAAARQIERLLIEDDRLVGQTRDASLTLTGRIEEAWFVEWTEISPLIGRLQVNGAVALRDHSEKTFVIPLDEWWTYPAVAAPVETALGSSGLLQLVERFAVPRGSSISASRSLPANAELIVPRGPALFRRAAIVPNTVLVGGLLLVSGAFLAALFLAATVQLLPLVLWSGPAIVASAAGLVGALVAINGRRRVRTRDHVVLHPVGPRWFSMNAGIAVEDAGDLVLIDGQGLRRRLATPVTTNAARAVVRAVFTTEPRSRLLLIDGTHTVRAQFDRAVWFPNGADELITMLHSVGIMTSSATDERNDPKLSIDESSSVDLPARSLVTVNALGVARVTPVAAAVVMQLYAASFAAGSGQSWAAAVCWGLAALTLIATCTIIWNETAVRVGDPARPRPRFSFTMHRGFVLVTAVAIGGAVLTAGTALAGRGYQSVFSAIAALLVVLSMWAAYRRRVLLNGHGAHSLVRWWAIGAPRGDES